MIKIDTSELTGEEFEKWKSKAEQERNRLIEEWRTTGKKPSSKDFKSDIWRELKEKFLKRIHGCDGDGKCAYCEADISACASLHVEHYRPKSGVTVGRRPVDHHGYFWLAYEWHNLFLCCPHCNTYHDDRHQEASAEQDGGQKKKHPGKLNEFRVESSRVGEPPSEDPANWKEAHDEEMPLLLHPYFDDPVKNGDIEFDDLGQIRGLSDRGMETVEVCHLYREKLVTARINARDAVVGRVSRRLNGSGDIISPQVAFSAWLDYSAQRELLRTAQAYYGEDVEFEIRPPSDEI